MTRNRLTTSTCRAIFEGNRGCPVFEVEGFEVEEAEAEDGELANAAAFSKCAEGVAIGESPKLGTLGLKGRSVERVPLRALASAGKFSKALGVGQRA
jgi:hypothetical protein